jgi:hypothetical protein
MSPLTHPPLAASRSTRREPAAGGFSGLLWLTWRQHRWSLLGSLLIAAVLAGWMAYLAAEMTTLYHQCHDQACPPYSSQHATLSAPFGPVAVSNYLLLFVQYAPLLIGVFIGVPLLAREHEQRTLLLAWSQDISPARWLLTKLALLGGFVAALTAAVSAVSDHLAHVRSAVDHENLFGDSLFLVTGMLPLAVGICWFAVGVALGAAIRRTLPAVFGVIAGFVALTVGVRLRYPNLMTPLSSYTYFDQPDTGALRKNTLIVNGGMFDGPGQPTNLFDSAGHELDYTSLQRICPDPGPDPNAMLSCLVRNHLQTYTVYQPGNRIPAFHLILASGYLGLGALALAAVWLIVRRTSLSAG